MLQTVNSPGTDPAENLAFEESLLAFGREVFMLWRNAPSVIAGRFVKIDEAVDTEYAALHGIPIVRRKSGGGAVYHDLGNVNYTFIMKDSRDLTLEYFSRMMIRALEAVGVNAVLEFRHNDILADGLKISGAAQYHREGFMLHHGTLLFDADIAMIPKVLKNAGRVANIRPLLKDDMTIEEFMRRIHDYVQRKLAVHEK
ncbi:MAG: lipoate--protein ligase family protein [Synergistaceae bacterium]|nr:lipoate--protein ligase family protein [Synergistaceae bacterium]MBR0034137.1 lipoate--protein ligase family protein [Synergistaceae bacterium]